MTQQETKEFLRGLLIEQVKLIAEESKKQSTERNESLHELTEAMSTVVRWLISAEFNEPTEAMSTVMHWLTSTGFNKSEAHRQSKIVPYSSAPVPYDSATGSEIKGVQGYVTRVLSPRISKSDKNVDNTQEDASE
jgi:hypothetical protein